MSLSNPGKKVVDVTALQAMKGDTLAILHQENVWIFERGTSTHTTWGNKCAKNMFKTQILSL
jgi:hypothetical protein